MAADVHDPWAEPDQMRREHGLDPVATPEPGAYDAIVVAVAHRQFHEMGSAAIRALGKPGAVLYDIKGMFGKSGADLRL